MTVTGPAGERALIELANDDAAAWQRATDAACAAIDARIRLWHGVQPALPAAS